MERTHREHSLPPVSILEMYIQQYFRTATEEWLLRATHLSSFQIRMLVEIILSRLHADTLREMVTDKPSFFGGTSGLFWFFAWFLLLFIIFPVKDHMWSWWNMITESWTLSQHCDWMELLWHLLWETVNAFPCRKKMEYNYIGCIISPQYLLPAVSVYSFQKNIPTADDTY